MLHAIDDRNNAPQLLFFKRNVHWTLIETRASSNCDLGVIFLIWLFFNSKMNISLLDTFNTILSLERALRSTEQSRETTTVNADIT